MKAQREKALFNEFLSKYKSRVDKNGQIKAPVENSDDEDLTVDDRKNEKNIEKKCKSEIKDSYAERQSKFFARFMPEQPDEN